MLQNINKKTILPIVLIIIGFALLKFNTNIIVGVLVSNINLTNLQWQIYVHVGMIVAMALTISGSLAYLVYTIFKNNTQHKVIKIVKIVVIALGLFTVVGIGIQITTYTIPLIDVPTSQKCESLGYWSILTRLVDYQIDKRKGGSKDKNHEQETIGAGFVIVDLLESLYARDGRYPSTEDYYKDFDVPEWKDYHYESRHSGKAYILRGVDNYPTNNDHVYGSAKYGYAVTYAMKLRKGNDFHGGASVDLWHEETDESVFNISVSTKSRSTYVYAPSLTKYDSGVLNGMHIDKYSRDIDNGSKNVFATIYTGDENDDGALRIVVWYDDNGNAYKYRKNRFFYKSKEDAKKFLDEIISNVTIDKNTLKESHRKSRMEYEDAIRDATINECVIDITKF